MTPERRAEIEACLKADKEFFKKNSFTNWRGNAWQSIVNGSIEDREELLKEIDTVQIKLNNSVSVDDFSAPIL